jgi:predicted deacylase
MQQSVGKSPSGANAAPFLTPFLGHVFVVDDELHLAPAGPLFRFLVNPNIYVEYLYNK